MRAVVRILLVLLVLFLAGAVAIGIPLYRQVSALSDEMEDMTEQARAGNLNDHELARRFAQTASARGFLAEDADITVGHPEPGTVEMKATFKVHPIPNSGLEMTVGFQSKRP